MIPKSVYRNAARAERMRALIKARGFAPNGALLWPQKDDEKFARIHPDYPKLVRTFPHRTRIALRCRARRLGVAVPPHRWTSGEKARLRRMFGSASRLEIMAAFPFASWNSICKMAYRMGLSRPKGRYKTTGHPIMDKILDRMIELGFTLRDLDEDAKTGRYFRNGSWRKGSPDPHKLIRAVMALDGVPDIVWREAA